MHLLLDTHVLLWTVAEQHRLSRRIRDILADAANVQYISIASLWEITIKAALGKLPSLPKKFFESIESTATLLLPVEVPHLKTLEKLPLYHKDPFDRILIAQAQYEDLTLVTHDPDMKRYKVSLLEP